MPGPIQENASPVVNRTADGAAASSVIISKIVSHVGSGVKPFFYQGNTVAPGTLYVSEMHVCFYSNIFGNETKVMIKFKDIQEIYKKRKLMVTGIQMNMIIRTMIGSEHAFSSLIWRKQVYNFIIAQLSATAKKILHDAFNDQILATSPKQIVEPGNRIGLSRPPRGSLYSNLEMLEIFEIPQSENIHTRAYAACAVHKSELRHRGNIYVTDNFLCFHSSMDVPYYHFSFPLFCISGTEFDPGPVFPLLIIITRLGIKILLELYFPMSSPDDYSVFIKTLLKKLGDTNKYQSELVKYMKKSVSYSLVTRSRLSLTGFGAEYGYIENTIESDSKQMMTWENYFERYGASLTLVRTQTFIELVEKGIPNLLRGEVWEICSGSIYDRIMESEYYPALLKKNEEEKSLHTADIDKDLKRSLPGYPAYQTPGGLDSLRRVLHAFSWHNPEIGYCQSMNVITGVLLIYLSEEQAFWLLNYLCEKRLKGYYSVHMAGVAVDSTAICELIQKHLPALYEHMVENSVKLPTVINSWLLALFSNCFSYANFVRILDLLICIGPRILYQICLAMLKLTSKLVIDANDEGEIMNALKSCFEAAQSGDDFHLEQSKPSAMEFSLILETALVDYAFISNEMVHELRQSYESRVAQNLNDYIMGSIIHGLDKVSKFTRSQLLSLCNLYYECMSDVYNSIQEIRDSSLRRSRGTGDKDKCLMDYSHFRTFIANIFTSNGCSMKQSTHPSNEFFTERIFRKIFDIEGSGVTDFCNVVKGLSRLIFCDFLEAVDIFFGIHDEDGDGQISGLEVFRLISTLYAFLKSTNNQCLVNISKTIIEKSLLDHSPRRCFSYFLTKEKYDSGTTFSRSKSYNHNILRKPSSTHLAAGCPTSKYWGMSDGHTCRHTLTLPLPVFREIALSNDILNSYFSSSFQSQFKINERGEKVELAVNKEWSDLLSGAVGTIISWLPKMPH